MDHQLKICNRIIELLNEQTDGRLGENLILAEESERLLAILDNPLPAMQPHLERPDTPLAMGCLLTGTRLDPSLVSQLRKELLSADQVDILCSFIKWSGIRILEEQFKEFTQRPCRLERRA
ncbi:MAG TPA: hypothetical protein PLD73_17750 [Candidatus Hydrogenedentes bacterium]|nr:hypothetical protein [Candidatus Hydrogenedentota bacterium]